MGRGIFRCPGKLCQDGGGIAGDDRAPPPTFSTEAMMPHDWIREYIYLTAHPLKQWQAQRLEAQFLAKLRGTA